MVLLTLVSSLTGCHGGGQTVVKKQEARAEPVEDAESFGYKCGWLAIRSSAPSEVIARLGIRDVRRASWREGIDAAYEPYRSGPVYVTPAIDG